MMKLNPDFFAEVMRLIEGEVISPSMATKNSEQLESVEEFFAWLLLRQELMKNEPEFASKLMSLAGSTIIKAETRRQQFDFPTEQRLSLYRIEETFRALLENDHNNCKILENVDLELLKNNTLC